MSVGIRGRGRTHASAALGDGGVESDVPVTVVATDVCRRSERRGRAEPAEDADALPVFDRPDALSSVVDASAGAAALLGESSAAMRGSRILSPEDADCAGASAGFAGAGAAAFGAAFSFFGAGAGAGVGTSSGTGARGL